MTQNPQLDLASNFVHYTDKNIFLTGKAGTGKTTFLHNLKKSSLKRMAVVAPTGVAAINAGGVTIHSFFQLPFGPFIPGNKDIQLKRFPKDKINLIKSLDLLVIDEISMVRADTLDNIDDVLRRFKDHSKPFGGLQLLMIGDLHQLSPVVKDQDWQILRDYYSNLFFFNSRALQKTSHVSIELKHIYRQSDSFFIDLLNRVRENRIDQEVLSQLNSRYIKDFKPADDEGYITLTTHNNTAVEINELKLLEIKEKSHTFKATLEGDFPEYTFPTALELEIKPGAQVMFAKNDPSKDRLFYNGKIGKVSKIQDGIIYVKCPSDLIEIAVEPLEWSNIKYELNAETKEVTEKVIGRFIQYPLKLAWAITIHKSQGLTFEKAIIDANAAFAHGQVYVALSRCKSFEGLVLKSEIAFSSIRTDGTVATYTKEASNNEPDDRHLRSSKSDFQRALLFELFDFSNIKTKFFYLKKTAEDHSNSVSAKLIERLAEIKKSVEEGIYEVSDAFKKQLTGLFKPEDLPEEDSSLQQRVQKACTYFIEKIDQELWVPMQTLNIESDNKAVRTSLKDASEALSKEVFIKQGLMKVGIAGFNTLSYLQNKTNIELDYISLSATKPVKTTEAPEEILHAELFTRVRTWRNNLASEQNVPVYIVLPQKALIEVVNRMPSSRTELEMIKGIGKMKVQRYGDEILSMITEYCNKKGIQRSAMQIPLKEEKIKVDTKQISFDLYKEGKSIAEIAVLRGFSPVTIEGHLAHYVSSGKVSVFDLVSKLKVAKITAYLFENPGQKTGEVKVALGDEISYGDIKAVMNHLTFVNAEPV
ncbi:HRDC domain-containing protein [Paradesertivirga mongoliensis]|uniref:HRDC domain-containing protein n=1 Tax=Paradesertivirga mongoliensis TaxID=2100740 RepID=A0ABW4ZL07_9SPHI|nr:HRDC domain-containing protein [Pedobacter mongoliensis]